MIQKTLKEIAKLVAGEVVGNGDMLITGVAGIKEASEGDITFLANPKYMPLIDKTLASAIITSKEISSLPKAIIRTDNPSLAFTKVVSAFTPQTTNQPKGIHPTAVLGKSLTLGKDVSIGPYTVVEDNVTIGGKAIIYPGCFIGHDARIGPEALIYPNVSIREGVIIGSRVIIHSGAVIGSDGFGFVNVDGRYHKVPQVGTVEIGDDVEIGANAAIDRARFDKTIIGKGTKIDNLVHIAHNVVVGENSIIVAQAGISGSTTIGKNVTIAGQAGLVGHITVGDGAVLAAQAGVTKSVPSNTTVSGYPAKPHEQAKKINACVQNLPRLYKLAEELKKKIAELESKLHG
ncbi:MAG TPA: UDP-3-O-(3-hydroxymyristoyl)glucosamine N-acyltransferase [Candidatus Omnitrophota bacterium]|nr:UDP-3-O-(3-hydroxymyristoyl)glucosamine N-acyltransferase [Candidatus Omnitrophota bacterium]